MRLDVRFEAVPVEAMRAFLEPLGYRFDWGPELEGIGFHWQKQPLSGTGVRATYFPDGGEGLLVIETDGLASAADAAMQDVTARLLAERFVRASVWCATTEPGGVRGRPGRRAAGAGHGSTAVVHVGDRPVVVDRRPTPRGELVLRRAGAHFEVIANGTFLMDTRDGRSERALVREAIAGRTRRPPAARRPRRRLLARRGAAARTPWPRWSWSSSRPASWSGCGRTCAD